MRTLPDVFLIAVALIAAAWWVSDRSYEPTIVLLTAIGAFVARAASVFRSRDLKSLLGRMLLPIARWRDRNTPLTQLEFDSLSGTKALHHFLKVWRIWDTEGPTTWIELRHRQDGGSWVTPYKFEGHTIELETRDIDADGNPEVVIRYACGAHTRVVQVLKVSAGGYLEAIPGAEVGSDWPEILLEDRDGDGIVEIYAKQRDWNGIPTHDAITEVYTYSDGVFSKTGGTSC